MRFYFLVLGLFAVVLALHFFFPGASQDGMDMMRIIYVSLLLLLVGSGVTLQRASRAENMRNAGLWLVIIAGLVLAYELLAKIGG